MAQAIQTCIQSLSPHLLWAEHSEVAAAVCSAAPDLPWIYSHHDMRYLIRLHRAAKSDHLDAFQAQFARRAEIRVIRAADVVLTGSSTEQNRLRRLGCPNIACIRMAYSKFPSIDLDVIPADVHITHVGSLETTANRSGLSSYLALAHPTVLAQAGLPLIIVGDATRTKPPLSELLLQPRVVCMGYVSDLGTVLRPYDISILPYTQDSGYRTKLPLLMGYGQVIVSTRAALAGSFLPGLEQVCVLLDRVEDFPEKIVWLAAHPEERRRLGLVGRAFAEQHFSPEAVRPMYADLMRQMIALMPASQHMDV
jgi:glycosyltransferase involved in cell wall biosynthesis